MKIDLPDKRYYSIGEVASKFQVKTSLIRFWEQEFKILNPKKKILEVTESLHQKTLKILIKYTFY